MAHTKHYHPTYSRENYSIMAREEQGRKKTKIIKNIEVKKI